MVVCHYMHDVAIAESSCYSCMVQSNNQGRCGVILAMGLLDQNSVRTELNFIHKRYNLYTLAVPPS